MLEWKSDAGKFARREIVRGGVVVEDDDEEERQADNQWGKKETGGQRSG